MNFCQEKSNCFIMVQTTSATDILLRGIDLCAGQQKRDFSCGSGFYLSNSLDSALNWAKSTTAKPAILVFKVKGDILNDQKPLNLINNEEISGVKLYRHFDRVDERQERGRV